MDRKYAEYLLKKTRDDYNRIAEEWSRFKIEILDAMKVLAGYSQEGDKVLDIGCGNGRLIEAFKGRKIDYYGVDVSREMIGIAKAKHSEGKFQIADALNLPFSANYFDKIYSIAVFHHIPSKEFRLQFLREAKRVLKPEGLLILTVWNLNPVRMIFIGGWKRFRGFLKATILKFFGKSKLDFKDFYISWRGSCYRYIHWFTKNELKKLAERSDFKVKRIDILKSAKTKESNIFLITQK